jgi:hypothetical protein
VRKDGSAVDLVDFSVVDFSSGTTTSRIKEICGGNGEWNCYYSYDDVVGATFGTSPSYSAEESRILVADDGRCGLFPFQGAGGGPVGHVTVAVGEGPGCPNVQIAIDGTAIAVAGLQENNLYQWVSEGFSWEATAGSGSWFTAGVALSGTRAWFAAGNQIVGYDQSASPPAPVGTYDAGTIVTAPVIDHDGYIYFAAADGTLNKLHADGTLLWTLPLGGDSMPGSPAIGEDGIVYLVDAAGALDAVDAQGYLRWTTGALFGAAYRSPMIDPCTHTLYVTTADESGVQAVVVDSAGLDLIGNAWPVYRHDYFGTGDAQSTWTLDCADHL